MKKYVKKVKINVELKNLNLRKNFLLNKKYSKLIGLKLYRLILILRLFNVRFPILDLQSKLKSNIQKKMDLILFGLDNIIFGIKFLLKYYINKKILLLIKPLKILIKQIKLKKKFFLRRYIKYVKNYYKNNLVNSIKKYFDIGLQFNSNKIKIKRMRRRIIKLDIKYLLKKIKQENKNIDFSLLNKKKYSKNYINVLKNYLVKQNKIRSKVKENRIKLLKLYQYIGQRRGFVFKKKMKNNVFYGLSFKQHFKNILSKIFLKKVMYNRKLFLVRRYDLNLRKYNFLSFIKIWLNKNKINKKKCKNKFLKKFNLRKLNLFFKKRKKKFLFYLNKLRKFKTRYKKTRTAILHFKSYDSNYYITLTDLSYKVIYSCSAGMVSTSNNKKTKTSTVVCTPMFFKILTILKAFRIKNLKFELKSGIDKHFRSAFDFFIKKQMQVKTISIVSRDPHHLGQRTNKPRRV